MYYYKFLFICNNLEENRKNRFLGRGRSGAADQRGQRLHTGPPGGYRLFPLSIDDVILPPCLPCISLMRDDRHAAGALLPLKHFNNS